MEAVTTRRSPFALRAGGIGTRDAYVRRVLDALGRLMALAVRAVRAEIAARRAVRELESLTERELRDIGLTRTDIGQPVRDVSFARFHVDAMWR
jgi:uncharacterized protein YjiS (DUF1127 family)